MHDCGWPRVKELTSRLVQVERGGEQGCFSIGSQGLGLACTEQGSEAGGGCKQDALPTNSRSQGRLGRDHEHWGVGSTKVRRVCVGRGPTGVGLCVCSWNLLTDQFQATRTALGVSDVAVGGPPAALLAEPDSRSALMANMPIQKGRDEARPCLGPLAMNAPMSVTNVNAMMNLDGGKGGCWRGALRSGLTLGCCQRKNPLHCTSAQCQRCHGTVGHTLAPLGADSR